MKDTENLCKIFISDSSGEKFDRTNSILSIKHHENKPFYFITFKNSPEIEYKYPDERVEIVDNCLFFENRKTVYDYLRRIACYSEMRNEKGENLLAKHFPENPFINSESLLTEYLHPTNKSVKTLIPEDLFFPFGANNSQYKAVTTAFSNSISIIQGPPGTGKTQTILNIIANLLIQHKTVLVVSNNNDAIKNIQDKLSSKKFDLDFLCACLGKKDNVDNFIQNQSAVYSNSFLDWKSIPEIDIETLVNQTKKLQPFFSAQENISKIQNEISAIKLEQQHYSLNDDIDSTSLTNTKLLKQNSSKIMNLWQSILYKSFKKEKISNGKKLKLFLRYGIGKIRFWITDDKYILDLIKNTFYQRKIIELEAELKENQILLTTYKPNQIYQTSIDFLHKVIYKRYSKINKCLFQDSKEIGKKFDVFQKQYPIVFSTTFSSRNCLPYRQDKYLYDYLIMDEASQVDIVSGSLALSCAKNCVVVGDKMQLPNVVENQLIKKTNEILKEYSLSDGYQFSNSFLESLEKIIPNIPQTLLREHYRCHPKIINFCNQYFYNNELLIMTEDKGEKDVLKAIKTIPGNHCSDNYNQRQIDIVVKEILPELISNNHTYDDIGIVTPYNEQVKYMTSNLPQIESATVHKFQGREKDVMIISTVDNTIKPFTDNPNLLNVAISRAKQNLYIIISGNEQPQNTNIMNFISYINYVECSITNSKVNSIYDYLYKQYTKERFAYLKNKKRISKFTSENLTYALLTKLLEKKEFSKYEIIFEYPFKNLLNKNSYEIISDDEISYATNEFTHIDFAIVNKLDKTIVGAIEVDGYKYHKKDTRQSFRDQKKNNILQLLSIPYLRLSTKDSDINSKVENFLLSTLSH